MKRFLMLAVLAAFGVMMVADSADACRRKKKKCEEPACEPAPACCEAPAPTPPTDAPPPKDMPKTEPKKT
jgi:hypothetical protein